MTSIRNAVSPYQASNRGKTASKEITDQEALTPVDYQSAEAIQKQIVNRKTYSSCATLDGREPLNVLNPVPEDLLLICLRAVNSNRGKVVKIIDADRFSKILKITNLDEVTAKLRSQGHKIYISPDRVLSLG